MWKKVGQFLSVCYLLVAICLLVAVCCYCYPNLEAWGRTALSGKEDSPVKAAFSVLSDSLSQGETLQDSLSLSYEALTGGSAAD